MSIIETDFLAVLESDTCQVLCTGKTSRATGSKQPETGAWNLKRLLPVTEAEGIRGDPQPPTIGALLRHSRHDESSKALGQQVSPRFAAVKRGWLKWEETRSHWLRRQLTMLVAFQELTKRVYVHLEACNGAMRPPRVC